MRAFFLTALLVLSLSATSSAFAMAIDVSDEVIRVTTGFNGATVTVFGTQDKPGAVIIVLEGPPKTMTVRKKSSVLGLWTNTDSRKFDNVPAFYEVAATGPLDLITTPEILKTERIGVRNMPVLSENQASDTGTVEFVNALFQMQEDKALFVRDVAPLAYPGPMLFKARFTMPAMVPQGQYKVSAYLFQDGQIVEKDSIPFIIMPEGMSADIRRFATGNGFLYGLTGMLIAVFAGWLATVLLKRE